MIGLDFVAALVFAVLPTCGADDVSNCQVVDGDTSVAVVETTAGVTIYQRDESGTTTEHYPAESGTVVAEVEVNGMVADFRRPAGSDRASLTWRGAVVGPASVELMPCEQEDSPDCYWLADEVGNGLGSSFIDLNGTAYYLH